MTVLFTSKKRSFGLSRLFNRKTKSFKSREGIDCVTVSPWSNSATGVIIYYRHRNPKLTLRVCNFRRLYAAPGGYSCEFLVVARFSKSWPTNVIFHSRFQTWTLCFRNKYQWSKLSCLGMVFLELLHLTSLKVSGVVALSQDHPTTILAR